MASDCPIARRATPAYHLSFQKYLSKRQARAGMTSALPVPFSSILMISSLAGPRPVDRRAAYSAQPSIFLFVTKIVRERQGKARYYYTRQSHPRACPPPARAHWPASQAPVRCMLAAEYSPAALGRVRTPLARSLNVPPQKNGTSRVATPPPYYLSFPKVTS